MMRGRRPLVVMMSALLVAGLGDFTPIAVATASDPIRYAYDPAGRLAGAVDPGVGSATYQYDAAGNITAISRTPITTLGVVGFTPVAGTAGTSVVLTGTGFSETPANNTVQFNGVAATVTAASLTTLTATVPNGATSGPISVTTGGATIATAWNFRMSGTAITAISTSVAVSGSTVTITGSGFDAVPGRNVVGLNTLHAKVLSATPTSLSVQVPSSATAGQFTVMNVSGMAVSAGDLYVPPSGFAASDVQVATRVAYGASTPVAISTSGRIAMLIFDGTAGQRISVQNLSSSMGNQAITIAAPRCRCKRRCRWIGLPPHQCDNRRQIRRSDDRITVCDPPSRARCCEPD